MWIVREMDNFVSYNRRICTANGLIMILVVLYGGTIYGQETTLPGVRIDTITSCDQHPVVVSCSAGSQIAISSAYHGFYNESRNCSSDNTDADCLQDILATTFREGLSGKSDGTVSCSNAVADTCNSSALSPVSSSCQLSYQCLPSTNNTLAQLCSPGKITGSGGQTVYIQNTDYANSGILADDSSCTFSVEISSYANIDMYIIDQELMSVGDCRQSIDIANRTDVLQTFNCELPRYNFIRKLTFSGTYLNVSLKNTNLATGGKIWYGFRASDTTGGIILNSPSVEQTLFLDCERPQNTSYATVSITGTSYQSNASYSCISGYSPVSGNSTRTCLANGTWSGQPLECEYDCGPLSPPDNGKVTASGHLAGHTANIMCNEGYVTSGSSQRTCIEGQGWNGTDTVCRTECPHPMNTTSVIVTYNGTSYQSVATYICSLAYVYVSGDVTRTCQTNGTWSGSEYICSYDCQVPSPAMEGQVSTTGTSPGDTVTYSCNDGYTLEGPQQCVCIERVGWNCTVPECKKEETDILAIVIPVVVCVIVLVLIFLFVKYKHIKSKIKKYPVEKKEQKQKHGTTTKVKYDNGVAEQSSQEESKPVEEIESSYNDGQSGESKYGEKDDFSQESEADDNGQAVKNIDVKPDIKSISEDQTRNSQDIEEITIEA